jgi:hypothetical protein
MWCYIRARQNINLTKRRGAILNETLQLKEDKRIGSIPRFGSISYKRSRHNLIKLLWLISPLGIKLECLTPSATSIIVYILRVRLGAYPTISTSRRQALLGNIQLER